MDFRYSVGCETTWISRLDPLDMLKAFEGLEDPEATLLLICKRDEKIDFSIWNYVEKNGLADRVSCFQYYDRFEHGNLREKCRIWVSKETPSSLVTPGMLKKSLRSFQGRRIKISDGRKHVLFFTGFHPYKDEGQGAYMRLWLESLKKTGHEVHLVYYQQDLRDTPPESRSMAAAKFRHYHEIPVTSLLSGKNANGLNIDLDDWCGREVLREVGSLADQYDFEAAFVVYPFYTAVFTILPPETRKVLISPDSFADRNRRMLEQGYSKAGWVSITREGERKACLRADVIAAIKKEEALYFRKLTQGKREVACVPPVIPPAEFPGRHFDGTLRIGYIGSDTWVNRECLLEFLLSRAGSEFLSANSSVTIAGGVCEDLSVFREHKILEDQSISVKGKVERLEEVFAEADLIINPEKGGTGLKIKTIEPMYFGLPVVSTLAAADGLDSSSRFHKAASIREMVPLLEELLKDPTLLQDLAGSSREIAERVTRESLEALSRILGCAPVDLDPGRAPAKKARVFIPGSGSGTARSEEKDPLISVVLPFYNAEKNLEASASSVLSDDYPNLELILVNDCSTDGSCRIAEQMAEKDSRIRILHHSRNRGAGPARNTGADSAAGEYLFFLDSDDILRRRSLRLLMETAGRKKVGLVIGSCNQIGEQGNYGDYDRNRDSGREECFGLIEGTEAMRRSLNIDEGSFLPVRPWGMLIDLKMYRNSGISFPAGEYEDLSVIPFLYKYAEKVFYLRDIVVTYRIRKGSVTQSPLSLEKVHRYRRLWDIISRRIEDFGLEDFRQDFRIFHVGHLLWLLHNGISDREVLLAAADLIHDEMGLDKVRLKENRNLSYMMEYLSGILGAAGLEGDFALWEKFVSSFGDDAVAGYFRHRMHELDY